MSYMLIDMNQLLIGNLMEVTRPGHSLEENKFRTLCLDCIRKVTKKFKSQYNEVIICCDNKHYWRKDYFPYYKSHRKEARKASGHDWPAIFEMLNQLRNDIENHFPYKVIDVGGAEADDVIAVLTKKFSVSDLVLIVSGDKDFGQLQKYPNVKQYSPVITKERFIKVNDPERFVKEHIIKGDRGDGIPNILSVSDTFIRGERQKRINKDRLEEWIAKDVSEFCTTPDMLHRFSTNQTLVDFDFIPASIQSNIIEAYNETKPGTKEKMLRYFVEKKLRVFTELIADF